MFSHKELQEIAGTLLETGDALLVVIVPVPDADGDSLTISAGRRDLTRSEAARALRELADGLEACGRAGLN